ncbi:luc7-like protein 3 [Scaptodrosophila lebanonensis]|uniref:Luc7-like protein 3 n=1 Tax=Drosophila lebanonensis TaxID=7225 RepID=A0A6J2UGW6_DROLE|nr:luc7-like protein 3 [Scaptodrosophila lebanonensis]XP_030386664.1 luc7-like protein 3 [Scaptodrosophila lebanonensis]XP_030386665.1 luc7-like protein 3 [Scaptodrosophila lebanonensis]
MVDAARQMLDELMGRNRNLHPSEAGLKVNWEDPEFCQFYNVKFCPHDLFINTRADLGPCPRIHDDEAKHLYEDARPSTRKRQNEDDFLRFCNVMLHDVDRKIQKGKQRLQLMQKDHPSSHPVASKYQEQLTNLNARINKLLVEAEEAGIRGDVDQAQGLMTLCEELKEEKESLQQQYEANLKSNKRAASPSQQVINPNDSPAMPAIVHGNEASTSPGANSNDVPGNDSTESNEAADATTTTATASLEDKSDTKSPANWSHDTLPEKQMKVCEICGAFLIVGDAQQRIEDHLMGKQHLGYSKLRHAVAEINDKRQKEREEDERRRREERQHRGNTYENRRDQRDYRERSRDYTSSRQSSERRHHHHKSHHGHSYSRSSSSNNNRSRHHYRHDSRERQSRSRSRY